MKKLFIFFFFSLGFISLLSQVTILRELIISFYGNELFIGIVLGIWLLDTGLGSLLSHKLPANFFTKNAIFLLLFLAIVGFPLEIFFFRWLRYFLFFPGESPDFLLSLLLIILILFPFCFLLGAIFTLGTRFWSKKKAYYTVSRAYFWEIIGLVTAGLTFNFILITTTFPFPASLNKNLLRFAQQNLVTRYARKNQTLKFRFPNLVESINSLYGNISVTETEKQYNFYESGVLISSSEEQEISEYFVHPILIQHPEPKKVLLIGNGLTGILQEILKYKTINNIDYIELDPQLISVQKKYLPLRLIEVLKNPKIKINFIDARKFFKKSTEKYDVVILNLPNPSTALLNRFYTKECFLEINKLLKKGGILALSLNLSSDYFSEEAINLASSINRTASSVFKNLQIFPEEASVLFLASDYDTLSNNPDFITKRFEKKQIQTSFLTKDYLAYRFKSDKITQVKNLLNAKEIKINTDFFPTGYFYENAFWQTIFNFKLANMLNNLGKLNFLWILIPFLGFGLGIIVKIKQNSQIAFLLTFNAGFTLMASEILTISVFQSSLGYVYSKIALIFAITLGFLAAGNAWATNLKKSPKKALFLIEVFLLIFCLLFAWLIQKAPSETTFYFLSAVIGFLIGMIFPLTNKLYLEKNKKAIEKTGVLYAADLFGAFLGAILSSLFLIPIFGVWQTLFFIGVINALSLILLQKLGLCK